MTKNKIKLHIINNKGLTLIEAIATIVILGIISAIVFPSVYSNIEKARAAADFSSLDALNSFTAYYAFEKGVTLDYVFDGFSTDDLRIQELVNKNFLNTIPEPKQKDVKFCWNNYLGIWGLSSYLFDFSKLREDDLIAAGMLFVNFSGWGYDEEDGKLVVPDNGTNLAFFELDKSIDEGYSIYVTGSLGEGNIGGYGINFDTLLDNIDDKNDTGYIFQFDRGYGEGEFIIRPRDDGDEQNPVINVSARNFFGLSEVDDATYEDWWVQEHEIQLDVSNIDAITRQIVASIDGQEILTYSYENELQSDDTVYSGIRGWANESNIKTIEVR